MKKIIIMLSMVMSANVFALEATNATLNIPVFGQTFAVVSSGPLFTVFTFGASTYWDAKIAAAVINDSQELMQNGEMTLLLESKIHELQEISGISENEALDLVIAHASAILEK